MTTHAQQNYHDHRAALVAEITDHMSCAAIELYDALWEASGRNDDFAERELIETIQQALAELAGRK